MNPQIVRCCTVLLVDDEEPNLDLLEGILEMEGFTSLVRTSDAREVVGLFEKHAPDLVLLDLHMPYRNGFEVLRDLCDRTPADDYLPILILTADVTSQAKERALSSGARDFLTKPFDAVEVLLRVENLLEARVLHRLQRQAREEAEAAQKRASLLSEVSRALGASLDGTTSLSQLPALLVPRWARASAVLMLQGEEAVPVAAAHADSALEPGLAGELVTGIMERVRERAAWGERSMVVAGPPSADGGPSSKLIAPIRVQGSAAAVLVLERPGELPGFTSDERELLEEIASRAGLALENARLLAEAELATRSRDRMLSVVAHDLRNPLAVVAMYGEMLLSMQAPDGDEYSRGALTSIYKTTGRIQRLVEDLLDVSSLEQGVFSLHRATQPLEPLLVEAERMLRPLADARGIELSFQGESDAAQRPVALDSTRLLQLLSNLVGNALKFTPPGGKVVVSWRPAGPLLELSVTDTGPGIPADQLPHVFGAFWQARDADRRGVGLGLWIARAIVEGHGGRIWVDSVAGRGAAFRFTLPATDQGAGSPTPVPLPPIGG
jgi:signal transduction histidine kinase/DNA-binding response OmpR family regulator